MIKALLLDIDGVLNIGEHMFSKTYQREFGVDYADMLVFFEGVFQATLTGKADLKQIIVPYLKKWKWNKSIDELLQYWHKVEHNINKPLVGYVKSLRKRGIKCYVATNQEKYRTDYIINKMEFGKLFDGIFSSAYVGYKKPQKEFFQVILKKIHMKPEKALFWDNDKEHLRTARTLGIQAEFYTNLDNFKKKTEFYLQ